MMLGNLNWHVESVRRDSVRRDSCPNSLFSFRHKVQWYFNFPCAHEEQKRQKGLNLPCGQGMHLQQLYFSLPWGQPLHRLHLVRDLPCGQGLHSLHLSGLLPCWHSLLDLWCLLSATSTGISFNIPHFNWRWSQSLCAATKPWVASSWTCWSNISKNSFDAWIFGSSNCNLSKQPRTSIRKRCCRALLR